VNGAIRKLVEIARGFVRFAREVDRGIAVGRGYAPVGKNTGRAFGASRTCGAAGRGARTARGRVRAHRTGRRDAGGRA
jgi:hypothetical protein